MNDFYDHESAKAAINRRFADYELATTEHLFADVRKIDLTNVWFKSILYPPGVRLMTKDGDDEIEVVAKITGVLCSKTLPPFSRPPKANNLSKIRMLRQYVKITAFSDEHFEEAMASVNGTVQAFGKHVGEDKAQKWNSLSFESYTSFEAHARYFTDRDTVPFEKNQPFIEGVDPHRILRTLQPDSFIHAADNCVEYCVEEVGETGKATVKPTVPATIEIGDVVEIVFLFVGVPVKGNQYKLIMCLRAVVLLENETRKDLEAKAVESLTKTTIEPTTAPKRRRLYSEQASAQVEQAGGIADDRGEGSSKNKSDAMQVDGR